MSSSKESKSENSKVYFVHEGFSVFAKKKDFESVFAINVGKCHLLEISKRDKAGEREFISLTHFSIGQLLFPSVIKKNLQQIKEKISESGIKDFKDLSIRIYGGKDKKVEKENDEKGTYNFGGQKFNNQDRMFSKEKLQAALKQVFPENEVVTVKGHFTRGEQAIDYKFKVKGVTFCRSSGLENPGKDDVSSDLRDEKNERIDDEKLERFTQEASQLTENRISQMVKFYEIVEKLKKEEISEDTKELEMQFLSELEVKPLSQLKQSVDMQKVLSMFMEKK